MYRTSSRTLSSAEGTWLKAKPAIGRPEAERFEEMSALKVELELD